MFDKVWLRNNIGWWRANMRRNEGAENEPRIALVFDNEPSGERHGEEESHSSPFYYTGLIYVGSYFPAIKSFFILHPSDKDDRVVACAQ
ncbi:MAG: hypothetical protein AAFR59_05870 [Bacteroidota bacterium]